MCCASATCFLASVDAFSIARAASFSLLSEAALSAFMEARTACTSVAHLSLAAEITALACYFLLTLGLGFGALHHTTENRQTLRGRELALVGVILSSAWLVSIVGWIIVAWL